MRRLSRKRKPVQDETAAAPAVAAAPATTAAAPPPTPPVAAPNGGPAPPPAAPNTPAPPAVAQNNGPPPAINVQNAKPSRPLDESERWFRSAGNLEKIAAALKAYLKHNKALPGSRFQSGLSWRVELLPYLGYDALYKNFDLTAAWDSPQNAALLKHIPPEFQSPERFDEKTNYLLPTGAGCCGIRNDLEKFEDGLHRTILVVEADEEYATPWTSPGDFSVDPLAARRGLGRLRPEGALIVLGDFRVLALAPAAEPIHVLGLFTKAAADGAFVDDFCVPPNQVEVKITPRAPTVVAVSPMPNLNSNEAVAANSAGAEAAHPNPGPEPLPEKLELPASLTGARADERAEIPGDEVRRKCALDFREVYKEDYEAAKKPDEKAKLVAKLLSETSRVEAEDVSYYVLNDIVRKMAAATGDLPSLLAAIDNLDRRFRVDGLALRHDGLTQVIPLLSKNNNDSLPAAARAAEQLMQDAIERDAFDTALKAVDLQRAVALRRQDKNAINEVAAKRQELEAARSAFREAVNATKTLAAKPGDPKASEIVGRYVTLVKNSWEVGLPLLAKSDDVRLRFVATIDSEKDKSAGNMAILGDKWWELAEELKPPFRRGAHLRAIHWYSAARPLLPAGLQKVRVEQRLSQSKKLYPEIAAVKTETATE